MQDINKNLKRFFDSVGFREWSSKHPTSSSSVCKSLSNFVHKNQDIKGMDHTIQALATNASGEFGEWWNFLSELRCGDYISSTLSPVQEYNAKHYGHVIDLLLENEQKWDVVSFSGKSQNYEHEGISDEKTIENLFKDKVYPKLTRQKADFVVIDDIFSANSRNYPLTWYFFGQAYSTRRDIFERIFGKYLHRILVLSFRKDLFYSPKVVFKGNRIS